jgi:hypothetical protein
MARFKVDFSERLAAAKRAKEEMLARFKARSAEDNSAVIERESAPPPTSKARAKRTAERSAGGRARTEREAVERKTRERGVVSSSGSGGARGGRGSRRSGQ